MSYPPSSSASRRSGWVSAELPPLSGSAYRPDANPEPANDDQEEEASSPPFRPSEAWIDAFHRQGTASMMEKAEVYARGRAQIVKLPLDAIAADDLVQWAVLKTLDGSYAWDPERVSLLVHVRGLIWWRTRDLAKHRTRFQHVSLQAGDDEADRAEAQDGTDSGNAIEGEATDRVDEPGAVTERMVELLDRQSDQARGAVIGELLAAQLDQARDADARAILDAYRAGFTTREEVVLLSGLSDTRYHNARRRLLRLAATLPDALRDTAEPAMRNDR